jgi:hypothetical protein
MLAKSGTFLKKALAYFADASTATRAHPSRRSWWPFLSAEYQDRLDRHEWLYHYRLHSSLDYHSPEEYETLHNAA